MEFEWDETKSRTNVEKHGVGFAQALDFIWGDAIIEPMSPLHGGMTEFA